MTTYNTLLNDSCHKYWEDLTAKEKEMLVNGHVVAKQTTIPNEVQFQESILNTLNLDIEKMSHKDLLEEFLNVRNLLFQAIKEDVERDLEKGWIENEEVEEDIEKDQKEFRNELLKDHPEFIEFIDGAPLFK